MAELTPLERIKLSIPNETNDILLQDYLDRASNAITERRNTTTLEDRYKFLQVEIAVFLYNKRGIEGQKAHSENGVSRTFENAYIPESMLDGVTPIVKVLI